MEVGYLSSFLYIFTPSLMPKWYIFLYLISLSVKYISNRDLYIYIYIYILIDPMSTIFMHPYNISIYLFSDYITRSPWYFLISFFFNNHTRRMLCWELMNCKDTYNTRVDNFFCIVHGYKIVHTDCVYRIIITFERLTQKWWHVFGVSFI